jgi:hypothetical protein
MYDSTITHALRPTDLLSSAWLNSEHMRVGASLLALVDPPDGKRPQRSRVFAKMPARFHPDADNALSSADPEEYLRFLETLHPSTLKLLCSLDDEALGARWSRHISHWERALQKVRQDGEVSPIAGAKLIANRILTGNLTAAQLIRIARDELASEWTDVPDLNGPLTTLIETLSGKRVSTDERITALHDFRRALVQVPDRWSLIEHAIVHQSYAWPLLIFKVEEREAIGSTLPIALDVYLDGKPRPAFISDGIIDFSEWEAPLRRALKAAKDLWKAKHLFWPREFRDLIERATAVIDLRVAEAIVKPYLNDAAFELTDNSAELYLSLAILANFLDDRAAIETVCATGILGRFRRDPEGGGDYAIDAPGDLDIKILSAAHTLMFDTILVPETYRSFPTAHHLQVSTGKCLSEHAGHIFFGQRHRKNQYVRGADLAAAYRSDDKARRDETRHVIDNDVRDVLRQLKHNDTNPVFVFDSSVKASSVVRALYHVNRRAAKAYPASPKENVGSFAVVRAVPDEINDRFWHVVWDVIKGSPQSFFDFRFQTRRSEPGKILARELNKLAPTAEEPARAPDVLIIVGSDHMHRSVTSIPNGPFSRLQLQHMVGTLRHHLKPTPVKGIAEQIGATRIILVPDGQSPRPEVNEAACPLDPELAEAVRKLSIFRFGFTFQMARHVLDLPERPCKALLGRLMDPRDGPYVEFGDGAGQYFLRMLVAGCGSYHMADHHFAAANAIVGFLMPGDDAARFNYREALTPAALHEAQWHLRQAIDLAQGRNRAFRAHERLSRIGELFGWTRIRYATRSREDGDELLDALDEHFRKIAANTSGKYGHPVEFLLAAKFAFNLAVKPQRRADHDWLEKRYADVERYLQWADESCCRLPAQNNEKDACEYVLATSRACIRMSQLRNGDGLRKAAVDILTARRLQQYESELLEPEWFEFMGDREFDPLSAAAAYSRGICNSNLSWLQRPRLGVAVKYLGACQQIRLAPPNEVAERLREFGQTRQVPPENRTSGLADLTHVGERWRLGRRALIGGHF